MKYRIEEVNNKWQVNFGYDAEIENLEEWLKKVRVKRLRIVEVNEIDRAYEEKRKTNWMEIQKKDGSWINR